ncbi:MAG: ester cyclase [Chitinophagaceae bacterium]
MKKFFMLAFAVALFATACNDDAKVDATVSSDADSTKMTQEDKEERNKKTALASVEAIASHDANNVLKDISPDAVDYGDGSMPPSKGADSIKAGIQSFMNAFPDYKGENLQAVADGDWVYVYGDWSGTFKNDLMGIKATGKSFKLKDVDIFKFNDEGKMTEHRAIIPWSVIMMQVGAKMPK